MRNTLLVIASLFISSFLVAQSAMPEISFTKELHDFGTIKEIDGVKSYKFVFKNTGKKPLIINNVKASCGCTTPAWTKAPIGSGKTGHVEVKFDPKNRPGPFNKTITVSSNASKGDTKLSIKGQVIEREKTVDDLFRYTVEGLKLKSKHIALTKVLSNSTKDEAVILYNTTDKAMTVEFANIPEHIIFEKTKITIPAQQKSYVEITYDAKKKNDWGFVTDRVMIIVNYKRNPKNKITISADIQEDFSKQTDKQLALAPKISFDSKIFSISETKQGEVKNKKFTFKNEGQTDLIIRKIKANCGCTTAKASSTLIKAGQSGVIDVTFDSKGQSGKQSKTISVITNDPRNSKVTLRVIGNVN